MAIAFRNAQPRDLAEVERLLLEADLITAGVTPHLDGFEVAEDGGRLVGCAGLEVYGSAGLLRSVAVDAAYRNRGVARELVGRLLRRASTSDAAEVFLLTATAAGYFRRFGFEPIARDAVNPDVQASAEFGAACCATAQAMRLDLTARAGGRSGS